VPKSRELFLTASLSALFISAFSCLSLASIGCIITCIIAVWLVLSYSVGSLSSPREREIERVRERNGGIHERERGREREGAL
jgi:hypothetical protein